MQLANLAIQKPISGESAYQKLSVQEMKYSFKGFSALPVKKLEGIEYHKKSQEKIKTIKI